MDIDALRRVVAGRAGSGARVGRYTEDGPVAMTLIKPDAGNGACWLGARALFDWFPMGLSTAAADGTDVQVVQPPRAVSNYGSVTPTAWGAYLADGQTGVFTSWSLARTDRAWLGSGPALFVKPFSGQGMEAYDVGSLTPRWSLSAGESIDFYAETADRAMWTDGARRIQTRALPAPEQTEAAFSPSTFTAQDRRWLVVGRPNGGFIIRPWDDALHGFVVVPEGQNAFSPVVVPGDDASHVVAFWSSDPGEVMIFAKTIDLAAGMTALTPPVTIVVPTVAKFNHAVSAAPFKDPLGMTACDSEVVVNGAKRLTNRPAWVAADAASMTDFRLGFDRGLYTETSDSDELRRVISLATSLHTRIAFCHDGTDLDRELVKLLRPWDEVWLECYRIKSETLAQSAQRWSHNLDTLLDICANQLGLIPQDYDMGGVGPDEIWTVQESLDACAACVAMVNRSTRIIVVAPFEVLRANGASAHPEFLAWISRVNDATPGLPVFAEVAPIPIPPTPIPVPPLTYDTQGDVILMAEFLDGDFNYSGTNPGDSGKVTFTVPPLGGPTDGVNTPRADDVISCVPGGQFQRRSKGAKGQWEQAVLTGGVAAFRPNPNQAYDKNQPDKIYRFAAINVAGL